MSRRGPGAGNVGVGPQFPRVVLGSSGLGLLDDESVFSPFRLFGGGWGGSREGQDVDSAHGPVVILGTRLQTPLRRTKFLGCHPDVPE